MSYLKNLSVSAKMFGIVGACLAALFGVTSLAIYQMNQIGVELTEIAEEDLPLAKALTTVTVHQLEQAIVLERAFRLGEEMKTRDQAREEFAHAVAAFEKFATKVDKELADVEKFGKSVV